MMDKTWWRGGFAGCFSAMIWGIVRAGDLEWRSSVPLPDPIGVAAPFAGVSGGALLVAGGAHFPGKPPWEGGTKVWTDTVWVLDRPDGRWIRGGRLPHPRAYGVSLTRGDRVLCVGGGDRRGPVAEVIALQWDGRRIRVQRGPDVPEALPVPLALAAGALDEAGVAYVACGTSEPGEVRASARVFSWDPASKRRAWREWPPLPAEPRILPVVASASEGFFLFGGAALETDGTSSRRRYLRDAWRFRPGTGWQRLADLPRPCAAAASPAPVVGGRIHLLGGDDGSRVGFQPPAAHPGFSREPLEYDPGADRWTRRDPMPVSRVTLPSVPWQGRWWLLSGEMRPGVRSPEVWSVGEAGR